MEIALHMHTHLYSNASVYMHIYAHMYISGVCWVCTILHVYVLCKNPYATHMNVSCMHDSYTPHILYIMHKLYIYIYIYIYEIYANNMNTYSKHAKYDSYNISYIHTYIHTKKHTYSYKPIYTLTYVHIYIPDIYTIGGHVILVWPGKTKGGVFRNCRRCSMVRQLDTDAVWNNLIVFDFRTNDLDIAILFILIIQSCVFVFIILLLC